ncbi:hypothetical protein [Paenibacillus donghaensis]|uniref:hypothetical protein n=1 Tax=Paenibacillus donghaensis TaxID=414771 RepID=UPI0014711E64|nr:hypothetical protein [Paenibacillus donghaensis]
MKLAENTKSWGERYFDGEVDYVDERYVSDEMKEGTEDCVEYLDTQKIDDEVLYLKREANSGEFYRAPFCSEIGFTNTYASI